MTDNSQTERRKNC